MKNLVLFSVIIFLFVACTQVEKESYDPETVKEQVRYLGNDIVQALNDNDPETLMRDFWKSESALFMIDGNWIQGHSNISKAIESIPQRRKAMDLKVDKDRVIVYSEEMAAHIVEFNQRVTMPNDSIVSGQGVWSTLYKKIDGDWKIVLVHESHKVQ
ncbi:MAG: hypothetical protein R3275_03305 [Saprospiraceae bacterium]|nr:hypothetical protein [Saprospiraceae bacterium]